MARVGRLAGAIVVETSIDGERAWFLVGDTSYSLRTEEGGAFPFAEFEGLLSHVL